MASEVLAVIIVQPPAGGESERARKRLHRMARVLKAASIPMHVWTDNALPSVETAREMIMPSAAAAPAAAGGAQARGVRRAGAGAGADAAVDLVEVREPPPSTWFDEFNSAPAPLGDADKRPG
jgi:hypothetical protein